MATVSYKDTARWLLQLDNGDWVDCAYTTGISPVDKITPPKNWRERKALLDAAFNRQHDVYIDGVGAIGFNLSYDPAFPNENYGLVLYRFFDGTAEEEYR